MYQDEETKWEGLKMYLRAEFDKLTHRRARNARKTAKRRDEACSSVRGLQNQQEQTTAETIFAMERRLRATKQSGVNV
uniref:Uncharacterized protein n=1 Tax=Hyaloperonospora arabidopsidis (strain Emoy2) TaxID=559515 RepID=M4C5E1_HYAAE